MKNFSSNLQEGKSELENHKDFQINLKISAEQELKCIYRGSFVHFVHFLFNCRQTYLASYWVPI